MKFLDFDSVERCLVLDLDSRYDLILGMAWLERHEPWIDWRSKTLGATRNVPRNVLESHEPTFARQQKRYWRGSLTKPVSVLDIGMSELIDSNAECIVGLGPGETARTPSSDTSDNNESLNAESIVGLRPSNQENNFLEKGEVAPISPPSMAGRGGTILSINSGTIGDSPGHSSMAGRGGTILSISSDTIGDSPGHFKSNPPDTSELPIKNQWVWQVSYITHRRMSNSTLDPLWNRDERVKMCRYLHKVTRASNCIHLSMVKRVTSRGKLGLRHSLHYKLS